MKKVAIIVAIIVLGVGGYLYSRSLPDPSIKSLKTVAAKIGSGTFKLYAPDTDEGLQKGLAVFKTLPENEGMIFRGLPVGTQTFWMKDMKFDIDILWVNKENQVIHVVYAASKDSYPKRFANPQGTASAYVVELNAGAVDKYGITPGTPVEIK